MYKEIYNSPIGKVIIEADEKAVIGCDFSEDEVKQNPNQITNITVKQLEEYFLGKRITFDLPLAFKGTAFQQSVWQALLKIPFGETRCYQDIAMILNNPKAVRAVGGANNKNNIGIIVPCHRVIGKNGKLVGYAGGTDKKAWLLEHEKNYKDKK